MKKIQEEAQANVYTAETLLMEASTILSVTLRIVSGNISVKPHNLSDIVSSGSWKNKTIWHFET